jgi:hypothetical protein
MVVVRCGFVVSQGRMAVRVTKRFLGDDELMLAAVGFLLFVLLVQTCYHWC